MPFRRMLPFILLNVVVSATVFVLLLIWWDGRNADEESTTSTAPAVAAVETPVLVELLTPDPLSGVVDAPQDAPQDGEQQDESGPTTHVVQAGDTLGSISQRYDVAVEDIATANNIVNVNAISVGQELIIPIGGLPTETPPPTAEPTATAAATDTPTPEAQDESPRVEISEVIGVGVLTEEAVRISNNGSQPLSLQGWQLEDESGAVYLFSGVTLFGSSDAGAPSILVHTEAGQSGASDLFWGLEDSVWQAGETVTLRDAQGAVQATYEIP